MQTDENSLPEPQKFQLEIGENLLKAIKVIVKTVENENKRGNRKLCPGKELQTALGINMVKTYKQYINYLKHVNDSSLNIVNSP